MITATVLYPKTGQSRFDHAYYLETHMPLVRSRWKAFGLEKDELFRGLPDAAGSAPAYELIGLLFFTSSEAMQSALEAHGSEILGDIPNFTDVEPVIQVSAPVAR